MMYLRENKILTVFILLLVFGLSNPSPAKAQGPSADETVLLQMINEARKAPLTTATSLGMDPDKILMDFPELEEMLTNGIPPLTFDPNLYNAAFQHNMDMIENDYYSRGLVSRKFGVLEPQPYDYGSYRYPGPKRIGDQPPDPFSFEFGIDREFTDGIYLLLPVPPLPCIHQLVPPALVEKGVIREIDHTFESRR